jgi:hypothetical protein
MKFCILILFIFIIDTHSTILLERAHWASGLRSNKSDKNRLKAVDNSKQLDVKIQGKGYFQYLIEETERLAVAAICTGGETGVTGKYLDSTGAGNTKRYPDNSDIPTLCSIRDAHHNGGPARYQASSGFTTGAAVVANAYHNGGFLWSNSGNKIQINLERQSGIAISQLTSPVAGTVEYWNGDRSANSAFTNANGGDADGHMVDNNWVDPEYYALKINTAGSMRVYTLGSTTCTSNKCGSTATACTTNADCDGYVTEAAAKWTLTGWGQTVLRGDVTETTANGITTTTLTVKDGIYRQFPADLDVNPQEDFSGTVYTEVISYQTNTAAANIAAGTVFTVNKKIVSPCDDYYLDGTEVQKATKCALVANTKASLAIGNQLVYQTRKDTVDGTTIRYFCEVIETTKPHVETSNAYSVLYRCNNVQGTHVDSYETRHDTRLIYNRYGRLHVNRYGFLVDSNGLLLIGKTHEAIKGAIHIPSRYDDIIIMRNGKVYASYDFSGSSVLCGTIDLVRFANKQGLGLYNDAPITTNCKSENKVGFALGTWCADTDLDGLDVWYYTESLDSGTPIEASPMSLGFGSLRQYTLATKTSDLYIGGVVPSV